MSKINHTDMVRALCKSGNQIAEEITGSDAHGLHMAVGITREETIEANIAKLGKRYEGFNYSDQAAQTRADKEPGQ